MTSSPILAAAFSQTGGRDKKRTSLALTLWIVEASGASEGVGHPLVGGVKATDHPEKGVVILVQIVLPVVRSATASAGVAGTGTGKVMTARTSRTMAKVPGIRGLRGARRVRVVMATEGIESEAARVEDRRATSPGEVQKGVVGAVLQVDTTQKQTAGMVAARTPKAMVRRLATTLLVGLGLAGDVARAVEGDRRKALAALCFASKARLHCLI